jgi:hypothetical protein
MNRNFSPTGRDSLNGGVIWGKVIESQNEERSGEGPLGKDVLKRKRWSQENRNKKTFRFGEVRPYMKQGLISIMEIHSKVERVALLEGSKVIKDGAIIGTKNPCFEE